VSVTHDVFDEDIDIGRHAVMNLLNFKDRAREVLYERANGLQGSILFNGDGKRQDEVPFNVANDSTIPRPFTQRLESHIGCLRCHGPFDGWQPFPNDVRKLTDFRRKGVDIFADLSEKGVSTPDIIDRLAGLYEGEPEPFLAEARGHYMKAVLKATGPWKTGKADQTEIVKVSSERISEIWARRNYALVDAKAALEELGVEAPKGKELDRLRQLLPPEVIPGPLPGPPHFLPEDPRIGALKAGLGITRVDLDLSYSFMAGRVAKVLAAEKAAAQQRK
jgi:hypothetical protein